MRESNRQWIFLIHILNDPFSLASLKSIGATRNSLESKHKKRKYQKYYAISHWTRRLAGGYSNVKRKDSTKKKKIMIFDRWNLFETKKNKESGKKGVSDSRTWILYVRVSSVRMIDGNIASGIHLVCLPSCMVGYITHAVKSSFPLSHDPAVAAVQLLFRFSQCNLKKPAWILVCLESMVGRVGVWWAQSVGMISLL